MLLLELSRFLIIVHQQHCFDPLECSSEIPLFGLEIRTRFGVAIIVPTFPTDFELPWILYGFSLSLSLSLSLSFAHFLPLYYRQTSIWYSLLFTSSPLFGFWYTIRKSHSRRTYTSDEWISDPSVSVVGSCLVLQDSECTYENQ